MRILILGVSSLATRRLLPALDALAEIEAVDFGTTKAEDSPGRVVSPKLGVIYKNYDEALRSSQAEVVYVSLVNSFHELWVERALEAGKHVVVDKPAFLSFRAAERLLSLAARHRLALVEALVYPFHPQVESIMNAFAAENDAPLRVSAMLTFPPLAPDNFRYNASLGGGALWDLGPYAGSIGRLFFGAAPNEILCRINTRTKDVDTSFSTLLSYPGGRSVTGHFGFDTQYENRITLTGEKVSLTTERFFTTPPDFHGRIRVIGPRGADEFAAPSADSFEHFFRAVLADVRAGKVSHYAQALLQDAAVLDTMRRSSGAKHAD